MARKKKARKESDNEQKTVAEKKRQQYENKRLWINIMCLGGAAMAIFDASTHVLAVKVLGDAYKEYTTEVTEQNFTDWDANPVCKYTKATGLFTDMEGDETPLCSALASNPSNLTAAATAGMQCNLNAVLISNKSIGLTRKVLLQEEKRLSGACGVTEVWRAPPADDFFVVNTAKFRYRKKALNAARFAQIAFLLITIFLTVWFVYNVWTKRTSRMALLRQEHKPPELVEEELLTERLYTDPPEFPYDDHAPKSAPTYWVEHRSLQPVKMHAGPPPRMPVNSVVKKKKPKRRCAECKRYLDDEDEFCPICSEEMDELKKVENMSRKEKINEYMFSFCKAAEVRLMIMMSADMPALVVYVFYMAFTDDSEGLNCHIEAAHGRLGQYAQTYNSTVAIICCAGGFVSVLLLFFQVVYIESMAKKEDRAFKYHVNYEQLQERTICVGVDIQISIAMIPFAIAPVLTVLLCTGAKCMLGMSDYWWVVAGLFGLPWIGLCIVFVFGCLDFCNLIDSFEGAGDATGEGAAKLAADAGEGCCDCFDCCDCCGDAGEAGEGCCDCVGECCTSIGECCQGCLECCC